MDRPWFPMCSRDWLDCKELRRCSLPARAILADLMCLAHEGEPYGHLSDKFGALEHEYMASRCVVKLPKFRAGLQELVSRERVMATGSGVLFIPRMVRDEEIRLKRAKGGRESLMSDSVARPKDTIKGILQGYPSDPSFVASLASKSTRVQVRADSDSDCSSSEILNSESGDDVRFGTWEMDETFTPLVDLYRSSGKSLIDEDFDSAWWKWKVLDFEQKLKRIERLKFNLEHHCYSDPNFIPAPRKFVESEWKRELRAASNGGRKSAIQEAMDRI